MDREKCGQRHEVTSPGELAALIDSCPECWEAARQQLYDGQIMAWLRATGHEEIVERWFSIDSEWRFRDHDKDAGVEALIGLMSPATRRPILHVHPTSIQVYGIHAGQCKQVVVTVSNPGRGHLYGTIEMHPPTNCITTEPVSISANGMLGKTQAVRVNLHADRELAASSTLRFLSSGGTRDVYTGYRCLFPYMLLFPFLGMALAFLAYFFLMAPSFRILGDTKNIAFGSLIGPVMGLSVLIAVLVGVAFSIYARRLYDPRWWKFLVPSMLGGVAAGGLVLMLIDGLLDDFLKATDHTPFLVIWLTVTGLTIILLGAAASRFMGFSPRLYSFFLSGSVAVLIAGAAVMALKAFHHVPAVLNKSTASLNTVLVPEVLILLIGFAIGEFALEGYDYEFLDRSIQITHTGVVVIVLVVLLVIGVVTFAHLMYNQPSVTPTRMEEQRESGPVPCPLRLHTDDRASFSGVPLTKSTGWCCFVS